MELYKKIKTIRQINQLTQEDMAERLDMSTNGYSKIERGLTKLNLDKLQKIADILDIDLVELITADDKLNFSIIGDNKNNHSTNYIGANESVSLEIEKLKLIVQHKDEMIAKLNDELSTLKEIITHLNSH